MHSDSPCVRAKIVRTVKFKPRIPSFLVNTFADAIDFMSDDVKRSKLWFIIG
jgi:hypothetical protein